MAATRPMTVEELENEYTYKLMKKVIKREYPWVIDVIPPSEEKLNEYNLIFFDLVIDPYMFQKQYDAPLHWWVKSSLNRETNDEFKSPYFGTIFEIGTKEGVEIMDELEQTMNSVKKSPAIPDELRFKKDRNFAITQIVIPPISVLPIPEDVIVTDKD